ncbi:replication protein P [Leclercia adecarboxylata]|uniref:replication protein P n=1 Tax=Leclercia adecarboxylata TaxID=83655 RepID=UPI00254BC08F|nr:replication protein P [Leclercia adecarboxylata]
MKSLSEQIHNFDRENFRRAAHGLPEVQDAREQVTQAQQVAAVFNGLFAELRATFPAAIANFHTQDEFDEFRRQWLLAFRENGITTMDQVAAGMRVARQQAKPFLPSPGQFISWCRAEESAAIGLPDAAELVDLVYQYSRTRGQYPDAESYPWPNHATYWMVTTLYQVMRSAGLSDGELRRRAGEELAKMIKRIRNGEEIPAPVARLPVLGARPLTREQSMSKVQEIRAKFGFKGGRA